MKDRSQRLVPVAVVLLAAATIALIVWPGAVQSLTGVAREPDLTAPDDLAAAAKDDPLPFLEKRDQLEIRVAEATTLRQFLDRNRLNKDTQVRQIAAQLGSSAPTTPIPAGTIFKLRLTPGAEDVPGTSRSPKKP